MSSTPEVRDRSVADIAITATLLALFVGAFFAAQTWAFEARLVPQVICGIGVISTGVRFVQMFEIFRWRKDHPNAPHTHTLVSEVEVSDPADREPEAVFARTTLPEWARVSGWWAGFFVLLFVAGVYVAAAAFSFLYLRIEGAARVWQAALYAVVAVLIMYAVFNQLLTTPLPEGLLRN